MDKSKVRKSLFLAALAVFIAWPACLLAQQQYRVAACDWMMLKRQKLGEFSTLHRHVWFLCPEFPQA